MVPAILGWNWMSVIPRLGISTLERLCDQRRPPSSVRKIPPPVVPTKMVRDLRCEIAMAEIGVLSNDGDTGFQLRPLLVVCQRRVDPAQTVLTPLRLEGSMAMTVKARWSVSASEICRGMTLFHP